MASIQAQLDPSVVREGESIQNFGGGPVVVSSVFPMFEEKYKPIFDTNSDIRTRVHRLVDALFDADERVAEGHFFNITLNL